MIAPVLVKQPWSVGVNVSQEFTRIDDTTATKKHHKIVCIFHKFQIPHYFTKIFVNIHRAFVLVCCPKMHCVADRCVSPLFTTWYQLWQEQIRKSATGFLKYRVPMRIYWHSIYQTNTSVDISRLMFANRQVSDILLKVNFHSTDTAQMCSKWTSQFASTFFSENILQLKSPPVIYSQKCLLYYLLSDLRFHFYETRARYPWTFPPTLHSATDGTENRYIL